jgi:hypothetical protein
MPKKPVRVRWSLFSEESITFYLRDLNFCVTIYLALLRDGYD